MSKYTKLPQSATLEQKLSSYTLNDECWEYNGCTNNYGYCLIMVNRKLQYAHRLAWEFHNKKNIPNGMTVDHLCFNRKCINPRHLRIMPTRENNARHAKEPIKLWCDRHNCPRRVKNAISKRSGNKITRTMCPRCAAEHSAAYKKRKRTSGGNG